MKNRRSLNLPTSQDCSFCESRRSVRKKKPRIAKGGGIERLIRSAPASTPAHYPAAPAAPAALADSDSVSASVPSVSASESRSESSLSRLGGVAARVAHDFANLTLVMREQIALAQEDLPEGHPARRSLMAATLAAQQAADLSDALRQWACGAGDARAPVNLTSELSSWRAFVRGMIPTSVIFNEDLCLLPPMWIDGNAVALQRALANLVRNACEAMPHGGRLTLCAVHARKLVGSEMLLQLRDTGCGMPPDVLENVFKPFFSTKRGSSGRGLGMAIVREVADLHGGSVEIDSTPGRGTCVTLRLPVRATKEESSSASASGRRVSIVSVDQMLANRVRAALEPAGFRVTCSPWGQGETRVGALLQDPPQAFVLDVDSMPHRELEHILQLKRQSGGCGAVMLLRRARAALRGRLTDREYLLYKPFGASELCGCVARSMQRG